MTELYIIGTGGAAKEIVQLVEQINRQEEKFKIQGFIVLEAVSKSIILLGTEYELIEEKDFLQDVRNASLVISNGFPARRESIYSKFKSYDFPNLIHPDIDIHHTVRMGVGNILKVGIILTTDIVIGDNNYINRGVQLGHDVNIGNHNVINPGAILSGNVILEDCCMIGSMVCVIQNLSIKKSARVGAGAVVTKNVISNTLVTGIPAKES